MPRKFRDIRASLTSKGFEEDSSRHHIFFKYVNIEGKTTSHFTKVSHANPGHDITDNLLSKMSKQIGLKSKKQIEQLIDCPMDRLQYEKAVNDDGVIEDRNTSNI
jgi:beta-galactosidase GanA